MKTISADLFIATGCTHCPVVMSELTDQLKSGKITSLNITNIANDNTRASQLGIRSVPWFRLSAENTSMVFSGNHTPAEIKEWISIATSENAMPQYIEQSLEQGNLSFVSQAIQLQPEIFTTVIDMLKDEETSMHVRIGLDALIESFAGTELLESFAEDLIKIANSGNLRLQIDALHYIALTGNTRHQEFLEAMSANSDQQLKTAATEAIETLQDMHQD